MLNGRIRVKGAFADDSLIEAQIRRHVSDRPGFGHAEKFRLSAVISGRAHSENAVSWLEHADRRANGFDYSREIHAEDGSPRSPAAVQEPDKGREAEFAAIGPVDRGGMDPDQHLVRSGHRRGNVAYLDHSG